MTFDELFWRRAVVLAGAVIYWAGVVLLARRVRKRIGRSPNLKPRNLRERLLWAGWALVVMIWIFQPLLAGGANALPGLQLHSAVLHPFSLFGGVALTVAGYGATLWCYAVMGDAWRVGINRQEKNPLITTGPFGWVRHPIYSLQTVMLVGAALLLPTLVSAFAVVLHVVCVMIKSRDEEVYLVSVHGDAYRAFMARTGRLFPKLW